MKKLISALLIFGFIGCRAQQPVNVSQPQNFLKWLHVNDTMRVKIVFQGVNDTLATQAYARGFAGSSLAAGVGIKVSGNTVSIDTLNYRKQDSMYVVTDSTGIFKINGRAYPFKLRGGVWAFNHRLGDVLPAENDYAAFYPKLDSTYENPDFISHLSWNKIINTPNTLATYGILDGVRNAGGLAVLQADAFANRPAPGGSSSLFLATDSSILYYNNGTTWQTVSNPGGGGPAYDSIVQGQYGILTTFNGKTKIFKVDTTTLKQVFGSGSPGVVQIFTKGGLIVNGTDTVSADTSVLVRWSDTLSRVATRTFVTSRGYITSESDPVAQAKSISLTGTALAGINITGATSQTIGSNPTYTIKADTFLLATHNYVLTRGFISAETDPVATIDTINVSGVANAGIIVGGSQKQVLGASPTWTFKVDSALMATRTYVNNRGFITTETDPVATLKTIKDSAGSGILITGLATQALGTNPAWTFKADTALLATLSNIARNYLPLSWSANQAIAGNGDTLKITNGYISLLSGSGNGTVHLGNGMLGLRAPNNFPTHAFNILTQFNQPDISFQYFNGANTNEPLRLGHDSVTFFGPNSSAGTSSYIFSDGSAKFANHIAGITESTSDSSTKMASTQLVKQLLAAYNPGGGQTLTFGSGLLGGSYNGTSPVTAKVDSSIYATKFFTGATYQIIGGDSAANAGLWITKGISGKIRTFGVDTGAAATYFLRRKDSSVYVTPTALAAGIATRGTVNLITAGLYMTGGAITNTGTIGADSAAMAGYFMRRKDSVGPAGFATNYQLSQKGGVTNVASGFGLIGGPIIGTGALAFDSTAGADFHTQPYNDIRYRKSWIDSLYLGLVKDSLLVKHAPASIVATIYVDSVSNSFVDKGFKNTGNVQFATGSDSVVTASVSLSGQPASNITSGTFSGGLFGNQTIPASALVGGGYGGTGAKIYSDTGWISKPNGVTNISVIKKVNYDSVVSSTGTGAKIDTADGTNAGLLSNSLYTNLQVSYSFHNDTTTSADTIAFAQGNNVYFKRAKVEMGLYKDISQHFFGFGVDSNWVKSLTGWGGTSFSTTAAHTWQNTQNMTGATLTVASPSGSSDAVPKSYADLKVLKDTSTWTGNGDPQTRAGVQKKIDSLAASISGAGITLAAGAFISTATALSNVSSVTSDSATYLRVGNTVFVGGRVSINPTSLTTTTSISLAIPVNSNIVNSHAVAGTCGTQDNTVSGTGINGVVKSSPNANTVMLQFLSPPLSGASMFYYHYSYPVQ